MNKDNFLEELDKKLKEISKSDKEEAISYYKEIIEDSVEDGKDEKEVIENLGNMEDIINKVIENSKNQEITKKISGEKTVILLLLSPFILIFGVIIISLFIAWYSIILSMYAVIIALTFASMAYFIHFFVSIFNNFSFAIFEIGASILSAGLVILLIKIMWLVLKTSNNFVIKTYKATINFIKGGIYE